jgi:hypothetical protein
MITMAKIFVITETTAFDIGNSVTDKVVAAFLTREAAKRWCDEHPASSPMMNNISEVELIEE